MRGPERWSGVAAIGVLWAGIGLAVLRTGFPLAGELPLSRLDNEPQGAFLFDAALVVAAVLFLVFCRSVRRRDPVGRGFVALMVVGMLGQLVSGLVGIGPDGTSDPVHVAAALLLGISIPLFLWRYAAGQPPGPWRRTAYGLFWTQAVATAVGVGLSRAGVAPLAEIVPAIGFHLWVVVVTLHEPIAPGAPAVRAAAQPAEFTDPFDPEPDISVQVRQMVPTVDA